MSVSLTARLAIASAGVALFVTPAVSRDTKVGALRLTGAWVRPTPPGAPAGAGYVTITNTGARPDRLLGGSSPAVERVEVHEMKLAEGIMRMRPVAGGILVPPGQAVQLAPGGYHIMLIGPKKPFVAGETVPVTLRFDRAGAVRVLLNVTMTPPEPAMAGRAR